MLAVLDHLRGVVLFVVLATDIGNDSSLLFLAAVL